MNLEIGSIIKNLRVQHKITQEHLATFLGVTPQAISRWEAGNGYPDIEILPSIANFFSVSADDLLGMNRTEKEKRRDEIYLEMQKQSEIGTDNDKTVKMARKYVAEFPSDERIQMNLADCICRAYMWEENPDLDALDEAEKLYMTLIDMTKDNEFRYEVLESLASLYAVGYKDIFKVDQALRQLPTMKYCREQVGSTLSSEMKDDPGRTQDYIEKLTDGLGMTLEGYIIDRIPNDPSMWDEKIGMLKIVISLYKFIFGDNMLFYHTRVAGLYRVIATYKVAQGKYDDTLSCLEKMCYHIQEGNKVKAGDKYTSPFMNTMSYPEQLQPFGDFHALIVHNDAWYVLNNKLCQDRYDPIREMPGFKAIVEELNKIAF